VDLQNGGTQRHADLYDFVNLEVGRQLHLFDPLLDQLNCALRSSAFAAAVRRMGCAYRRSLNTPTTSIVTTRGQRLFKTAQGFSDTE
jgi:hypothetical protein